MIVVCAVTLSMLACGGLVSVPKLTDADNDQIVNIGDSIFALSGDIYEKLHSYAGETWRHYAISGARMIGGGFVAKPIPRQYHEAKKDDSNIRVVYMDGGANDILSPSLLFDPYKCKGSISQDCKDLIDDVYVETVNLLNEMDRDGVQQVIFLGYYYIKKGLYGDLSVLNDSVDHGDKRLADACRNSTVNCEFVDPRSSFLDDYIILDGIHPNKEGSDVLADLIWDVIDVEGSS
ncbi:MAG: SGNH/GDSL hydrolase family protein [Desulfobacteraceae bacterium]|nr:SGNH/GDSL hydrolase family protein [Desulfobacteraceae bacterium]